MRFPNIAGKLALGRLKIWQKLALLSAAFTLPLLVMLIVFIDQQNRDIQRAEKELAGLRYLQPLRNVLEHAIQHRSLALRDEDLFESGKRIESDLNELQSVNSALQNELSSDQRSTSEVVERTAELWRELREQQAQPSAEETDRKAERLVDVTQENLTALGALSGLLLDPELQSSHLARALITGLPQLQVYLGELAALTEGVLARGRITSAEHNQIIVYTGLIEHTLRKLTSETEGYPVVDRSESAAQLIRPELERSVQTLVSSVRAFLVTVEEGITDQGELTLGTGEFHDRAEEALTASFLVWDRTAESLRGSIQSRIDHDATIKSITLVGVGIALIIALTVALILLRGFTRQLSSLSLFVNEVAGGDLDARAKVITGDELGEMAASLNAMFEGTTGTLIQSQEKRDAIQRSMMKLLDEVSGVAEGDLTKEAEVTADMMGAIADSFNYLIEQLRRVIGEVQLASTEVTGASTELHSSTELLSSQAEAQAKQIEVTSQAISRMAFAIQQVSENAARSAESAREALASARRGNTTVQDTVRGMHRIRDQVHETGKRIKRLGESSQEIGETVRLIEEIAQRTGILALNASIQAATAGEAGRGFAVVAEEVERLAVRSTEATKRIATLVQTIQGDVAEAAGAMDRSIEEVVSGSEMATQAGGVLREIEQVFNRLADLVGGISQETKREAGSSRELARSMTEVAHLTEQTAEDTRKTAVSVQALTQLAERLRMSVSTFRLPHDAQTYRPVSLSEVSVPDIDELFETAAQANGNSKASTW